MKATGTSQQCYAKKHDECPVVDMFLEIEISCQCKCHNTERVLIENKEIIDRLKDS